MNIKEFATIPALLRNRQEDIKKLIVVLKDVYIEEFDYIVLLSCSKYEQKISFRSEFDLDSSVKVNCGCPSFNFEFANILYKNDSLLEPKKYMKAITKIPRQKNTKSVISGCKHIIAASQFVITHQKNIKKLIEKKKIIRRIK